MQRVLGVTLHGAGQFDPEAVQHGRHEVDGVVILVAGLPSSGDLRGPRDDARVAGTTVERVPLPHLERGVERHRPAVRVVVVGSRAPQFIQLRQVLGQVVRHTVGDFVLVDRAVGAALTAGSVVCDQHDQGVVELFGVGEVVEQAADLVVAMRQESGVHLGHPGEEPLLVSGESVPRPGVVQWRERLTVRARPGFGRTDRVDRWQLGILGDQTELLLPGQSLFPQRLVACVEPAPVPVGPLPRNMVRRMCATRRVIQEYGPVRGDGLHVVDVLNCLVGDVDAEVVTLVRGGRLLGRMIVVHQIRIPLVGLCPQEAIEAVETPADRPIPLGGCRVHLVLGAQMPLADHRGAEPVVDENFGECGALGRNVPVRAGKSDCGLTDAGHSVGRVIAAGQQARPGRGAQRGGMPLAVPQPVRRDSVDIGRVDRTAVTPQGTEPDIVEDDVQHIR